MVHLIEFVAHRLDCCLVIQAQTTSTADGLNEVTSRPQNVEHAIKRCV